MARCERRSALFEAIASQMQAAKRRCLGLEHCVARQATQGTIPLACAVLSAWRREVGLQLQRHAHTRAAERALERRAPGETDARRWCVLAAWRREVQCRPGTRGQIASAMPSPEGGGPGPCWPAAARPLQQRPGDARSCSPAGTGAAPRYPRRYGGGCNGSTGSVASGECGTGGARRKPNPVKKQRARSRGSGGRIRFPPPQSAPTVTPLPPQEPADSPEWGRGGSGRSSPSLCWPLRIETLPTTSATRSIPPPASDSSADDEVLASAQQRFSIIRSSTSTEAVPGQTDHAAIGERSPASLATEENSSCSIQWAPPASSPAQLAFGPYASTDTQSGQPSHDVANERSPASAAAEEDSCCGVRLAAFDSLVDGATSPRPVSLWAPRLVFVDRLRPGEATDHLHTPLRSEHVGAGAAADAADGPAWADAGEAAGPGDWSSSESGAGSARGWRGVVAAGSDVSSSHPTPRGPERLYYDTARYTGVARFGGPRVADEEQETGITASVARWRIDLREPSATSRQNSITPSATPRSWLGGISPGAWPTDFAPGIPGGAAAAFAGGGGGSAAFASAGSRRETSRRGHGSQARAISSASKCQGERHAHNPPGHAAGGGSRGTPITPGRGRRPPG